MNILKPATGTLMTAAILCNASDIIPGKLFELDFKSPGGAAKYAYTPNAGISISAE